MVHIKEHSLVKTFQGTNRENPRLDENQRIQVRQCRSQEKHREHQQPEDHYRHRRRLKEIQEHQPHCRALANLRRGVPAVKQDKNALRGRYRHGVGWGHRRDQD